MKPRVNDDCKKEKEKKKNSLKGSDWLMSKFVFNKICNVFSAPDLGKIQLPQIEQLNILVMWITKYRLIETIKHWGSILLF